MPLAVCRMNLAVIPFLVIGFILGCLSTMGIQAFRRWRCSVGAEEIHRRAQGLPPRRYRFGAWVTIKRDTFSNARAYASVPSMNSRVGITPAHRHQEQPDLAVDAMVRGDIQSKEDREVEALVVSAN